MGRASSASLFLPLSQTSSLDLFAREYVCIYARDVAWMERCVCVAWCYVLLVLVFGGGGGRGEGEGGGAGFVVSGAFPQRIVGSDIFLGVDLPTVLQGNGFF